MDGIGLQEAIEAVRAELTNAMAQRTDDEIRFRVRSVDLEFRVTAERSAEAGGKVRFWVVDANAGGSMRSATEHTLRVALDPTGAGGGDVEVRGDEAAKPG